VHRKRSPVAVIDQDGKVLANRNVNNGVTPILSVIGGLPPGTKAASGAASGGGWLAGLLEDYGVEPHLVHPLRCKAIASARRKNDKGRRGDLGPAAAGGPAARGVDRAAGGAPAAGAAAAPGAAGAAADAAAQPIHAVLAGHGCDRPAGCRSGPGREWLASLDLPAVSAEVIADAPALIDALESVTGRLDAEVRQHARSGPRVKVLAVLPGVGPFTALVLLAEIGDITRFASARKLASRAGLTPMGRGSDRTVRHGHIPGQGPAWLRWVMNQAAQTARHSPQFAAGYQSIARRRGTKIATTAVARKLLTRAWHLLTDASSGGAPH
jgi:transposase